VSEEPSQAANCTALKLMSFKENLRIHASQNKISVFWHWLTAMVFLWTTEFF